MQWQNSVFMPTWVWVVGLYWFGSVQLTVHLSGIFPVTSDLWKTFVFVWWQQPWPAQDTVPVTPPEPQKGKISLCQMSALHPVLSHYWSKTQGQVDTESRSKSETFVSSENCSHWNRSTTSIWAKLSLKHFDLPTQFGGI